MKKQASSLASRTANAKSDAQDIEAFRKEIQIGMDMILVRFELSILWLQTDRPPKLYHAQSTERKVGAIQIAQQVCVPIGLRGNFIMLS
jgi:hypothetical protein